MRLLTLSLAAIALAIGMCRSTLADMIARESFEYSTASDLIGTPGSGTGFSTNWIDGGRNATQSSFRIQSGSLTYSGLESLGNYVTGVASTTTIYAAHRETSQLFVGANNSQTTWMSFLIRQNDTLGMLGGFGGIYVGNGVNDNDPKLFIGKGGDASNTWLLENVGGAGKSRSNSTVVRGQSTLLVVKMETLQGNDRFTLFVNPDISAGPQFGVEKLDLDLGTANRITMYHTGSFAFDEIRIGTTFSDVVTAVPEPSSGLLVLAVASLAYWRRSRRTQ
ncbi:PEP-CTERM sorting domain-containing protein [Pirellulaceae bacterium SH501]